MGGGVFFGGGGVWGGFFYGLIWLYEYVNNVKSLLFKRGVTSVVFVGCAQKLFLTTRRTVTPKPARKEHTVVLGFQI